MTVGQFWTMISLMMGVAAGGFSWVLWATKRITNNEVRLDDNDKKWDTFLTNRKSDLLAAESERKATALALESERKATALALSEVSKALLTSIHESNVLIYTKLDSIKEDTSKMKENCGRHDERLKQLEKDIK